MNRLEVQEQILLCQGCELHTQVTAPVPFSGPTPAYLAIVGEAPGKQEDLRGEPFIGPAGQLLRDALTEAGISPETVFFCNSVSCFPDGTPTSAHVHACATNLADQLELARCRWVLLLGAVALSTLRPDLKISRARGHVFDPEGQRWKAFVTFHPSYALRNPKGEKTLRADLQTLAEMLEASGTQRPDSDIEVPGWLALADDSCVACGVSAEQMGLHGMAGRADDMGATYCSNCWGTHSPTAKAEAKEVKALERTQLKKGTLF